MSDSSTTNFGRVVERCQREELVHFTLQQLEVNVVLGAFRQYFGSTILL